MWLRIPTGQRQTSWLFTSVVEDLNSWLLRTTPASSQDETWTQGHELQAQHSNCSTILPPVWLHDLWKDKGANSPDTFIGKTKQKAKEVY